MSRCDLDVALVQMHHKIQTFEHVNRRLVLVTQDIFLDYMTREFNFNQVKNPAVMGDAMHLHTYKMRSQNNKPYTLTLKSRLSTDTEGIATCLGLQAEARVELKQFIQAPEAKVGPTTLFSPA